MNGAGLPVHSSNEVITDRDKDFLAVLFSNKKCLGRLIIHRFDFPHIPMLGIVKTESYDFVEIKLVAGQFWKQCKGKIELRSEQPIGFRFAGYVLKS